jgi:hypothetical protein
MSNPEDPAPHAGEKPQPVPPAATSQPQRVGWLTVFIVVAVLGSFRAFMFFGFESLTWRDTPPMS